MRTIKNQESAQDYNINIKPSFQLIFFNFLSKNLKSIYQFLIKRKLGNMNE